MLGSRIRVRIYCCSLDTISSSGSPHSPISHQLKIPINQLEVDKQGNFTAIGNQD